MPSALNTSVTTLLNTGPFTPTLSARWINGLLFASLILSLAAALLGILVKQWIREYLKWNAALAAPRENVLVRQIRFEAWNTWNVEAIIWSIPTLLRVGMTLFLVGVGILLWTLDDTVAIVITILTATFVGVSSALTVLPIFMKRCPYKSPTAWVLLRLIHIAQKVALGILLRCLRGLHHDKSRWPFLWLPQKLEIPKTWRDRDIDSCEMATFGEKARPGHSHFISTARLEIAKERTHLCSDGTFITEPEPLSSGIWRVVKDIEQTTVLLGALEWVHRASQDGRIERYIDECMHSIHPEIHSRLYNPVQIRIISSWCISLWMQGGRRTTPHNYLCPTASNNENVLDSITTLRQLLGVRMQNRPEQGSVHNRTFSQVSKDLSHCWQSSPADHLLLGLLSADLFFIVSSKGCQWSADDEQVRRTFEIVSMIGQLAESPGRLWLSVRPESVLKREIFLGGLRVILSSKTRLHSVAPGLCAQAFYLASRHGRVICRAEGDMGVSCS